MESVEMSKDVGVTKDEIIAALQLTFESDTPFKNVLNMKQLTAVQELLERQTKAVVAESQKENSGNLVAKFILRIHK
jgi:hypothetical protein